MEANPLFVRPAPTTVRVEQDAITFEAGEAYPTSLLNVIHLPNALAQVQSPGMAMKFVETYGPLLHWYEAVRDAPEPAPDPLPVFLAHASAVRFTLRLLEAMQDEDDEELAHILEAGRVIPKNERSEGPQNFIRSFVLPEERFPSTVSLSVPYGEGDAPPWRELAVTVVRYAVNTNTHFLRPYLNWAPGGKRFERVVKGEKGLSLVELIWYGVGEIALIAQDNKQRRIRLCRECETPFYALDGRQRFCPPDPWTAESRCASRHQQRQIRARRKKED